MRSMSEKNSRETRSCKEKGHPVSSTGGGDPPGNNCSPGRPPGWPWVSPLPHCPCKEQTGCARHRSSLLKANPTLNRLFSKPVRHRTASPKHRAIRLSYYRCKPGGELLLVHGHMQPRHRHPALSHTGHCMPGSLQPFPASSSYLKADL